MFSKHCKSNQIYEFLKNWLIKCFSFSYLIEMLRLIFSNCMHCCCWSCYWSCPHCKLLARACWIELVTQSRESKLFAARIWLLPGKINLFEYVQTFKTFLHSEELLLAVFWCCCCNHALKLCCCCCCWCCCCWISPYKESFESLKYSPLLPEPEVMFSICGIAGLSRDSLQYTRLKSTLTFFRPSDC